MSNVRTINRWGAMQSTGLIKGRTKARKMSSVHDVLAWSPQILKIRQDPPPHPPPPPQKKTTNRPDLLLVSISYFIILYFYLFFFCVLVH